MAVPFFGLFKVVHTFESLDEILTGDKLNESYSALLFFGSVYLNIL